MGLVELPTLMISDDLIAGRLVSVWAPQARIVHAVYASRRCFLPAVRALLDHLEERLEALDARAN